MKNLKIAKFLVAPFLALGSLTGPGNAALVIDITDNGTDTVFMANGNLNISALTQASTGGGGGINPSAGFLEFTNNAFVIYQGISGPDAFGTGGFRGLSTATGDRVGVRLGAGSAVTVPDGYVSEAPLSAEGSITGAGFTDIGITPGTYTWTWGAGADADSLTINATVIPEPSSIFLCGMGLLGFVSCRKR